MTKVRFTFVDMQGNPLPLMEFKILLRRASFNIEDVGVALPEELNVTTDATGQVIVELWPLKAAYRIQVAEEYEELCGKLNWSFYVPQTDAIVEAQTLFLVPAPNNVPWDEEAIGKINQAVIDSHDSAVAADASADLAEEFAQSIAGDAESARQSAADALVSKNAAAGSSASATNSAIAANASKNAAADSASAALTSQNAAKSSEINAAQSATTAASAGATAGNAAGTAAAQAVLANKVDKEAGKALSSNDFSNSDKSKLDGIAAGATANSSNATLLSRANHTGTQLAATISNFASEVRDTVLTGITFAQIAAVLATDSILVAIGKLQAQVTVRAMKGANSDITALSGLTTALSIAQGGTGGTTKGAAQTALGLIPVANLADVTAGRLATVGWMGLGSIATPYLTDLHALTGTRMFTFGSGHTANMIAGMDYGQGLFLNGVGGTEGSMLLVNHDSDRAFMKRKRADVYSGGFELHTTANSQNDPSLGTGGLISTTLVSGFRVDKYVNGSMCVTGKVSLPSIAANVYPYQTLTLPVSFFNTTNMVPMLSCNATTSADSYGIVSQRAASTSSVLYAIRNGATAQTFEVNVCVWGTWK